MPKIKEETMPAPETIKICECEHICDRGCCIERFLATIDDRERLKELNNSQFFHTPLHEAAEAGNTALAMEIMNLMPSLATKLNPGGLSPLHAAVANGWADTALALAGMDKQLVLVKGKGGLTPLHYAAADQAQVELLAELLKECPDAMGVVSNRGQTAVHVALENRNEGAAQLLVNWEVSVARESRLSTKDAYGNTTLHVAARYCHHKEVLKFLSQLVKVHKRNKNGETPLDIAIHHKNTLAMEVLKRAGATARQEVEEAKYIPRNKPSKTVQYLLGNHADKCAETLTRAYFFTIKELTLEMRNTILLVAALIATATYQGALQPPGGVYSAEGSALSSLGRRRLEHVNPPGRMVMGTTKYSYFMPTNTLAFIFSTLIIIFVLPDRAFVVLLQACLIFMSVGYLLALNFISYYNNFSRILHVSCSCAVGAAFSLKLGHYCIKSYYDKEAWVFRRLGVMVSNRRERKGDGDCDDEKMSVLTRMRMQYKIISKCT